MNEKVQPVGFGTSGHPALMDIYVGNNLRKARELKNITAEQLSKTLKIDLSAIEQYEAGTRKIKAVDLFRMALVLETTLGVLFGMKT